MAMSFTGVEESLEIMCERCINHEMCQGTGCQPKRQLNDLIKFLGDTFNKIYESCKDDEAVV